MSQAQPGSHGTPRRRRASLALCLSGGGYRAALFHLGALWRLHELGLLRSIDRVSSVSGGSILAAWFALRIQRDRAGRSAQDYAAWCDQLDPRFDLAEAFFKVTGTDIRTGPALLAALPNLLLHRFGAQLLAREYTRLLGNAPLAALPMAPDFVFCATDLTFGVNFEFSRTRVGDYQAGYLRGGDPDPSQIPIARAVAASSCFPPVFGPMRLRWPGARFAHGRYRGDDREALLERIDLSDGGVYDNLGTEPVLKHADVVLISDAGAPFPFRAGGHALRRLLRYTSVIGSQAVALRRRLFTEMCASGRIDGAQWRLSQVHDAGAFGYSDRFVEQVMARVRTDMDRFTRAECEVLVNHGYASCEAALVHRPELLPHGATLPQLPYPDWAIEDRARLALCDSDRRFVAARMLNGWLGRSR
jgi:NTE family protein